MPYIPGTRRAQLLTGQPITNSGDLNYLICAQLKDYFDRNGRSYSTYCSMIGVLIEFMVRPCAPNLDEDKAVHGIHKLLISYLDTNIAFDAVGTTLELTGTLMCIVLELYRRSIVAYEEGKREKNGDIPLFEF